MRQTQLMENRQEEGQLFNDVITHAPQRAFECWLRRGSNAALVLHGVKCLQRNSDPFYILLY